MEYNKNIIVENINPHNKFRGYYIREDEHFYHFYDFVYKHFGKVPKRFARLRLSKLNTIYEIYCNNTGKYYIGKTSVTINQRLKSHFSESKYPWAQTPLHIDMQKFGIENFSIKKIDEIVAEDCKEANMIEQHYIKIYNSKIPLGYNVV